MRLLVTGGCGFIGSNFINYMFEKFPEIEIWNIDKCDYCSNEANIILRDSEKYHFIKGNICSSDMIAYILKTAKIDTIVHFAAQSHVDNSFNNSLNHAQDNIIGTLTLLEETRKYISSGEKFNIFIHISTDEVYGESEFSDEEGKIETSILSPSNPYSASKAGAEMMVQAYLKSYKMPIIITRGNNVYGPRQYPEKLIPLFIKQLSQNKKCTVHGKGDSIRSFIYVEDTVSAISTILEKGVVGEIYNIGSDEEYSVLQVLQKLVEILKNDQNYEKYIEFTPDRNFNDKRYFVNSEKLSQLGWKKQTQFDDGIRKTIEWYQKN